MVHGIYEFSDALEIGRRSAILDPVQGFHPYIRQLGQVLLSQAGRLAALKKTIRQSFIADAKRIKFVRVADSLLWLR